MEPVRIKYYGLVSMTRSTYLTATLIAFVVVVVGFAILVVTGRVPPFHLPGSPLPNPNLTGALGWLYNHFYETCLVLFVLEGIDIGVTLRKFSHKEAVRRATTDFNPTNPS